TVSPSSEQTTTRNHSCGSPCACEYAQTTGSTGPPVDTVPDGADTATVGGSWRMPPASGHTPRAEAPIAIIRSRAPFPKNHPYAPSAGQRRWRAGRPGCLPNTPPRYCQSSGTQLTVGARPRTNAHATQPSDLDPDVA